MRADAFLAAAESLPVTSVPNLIGTGGLVVVAPHPDDESLGCGGLIAEAVAQGIEVRVIIVSDGVGSHPNSALYPPPRLRELREEETKAAVRALGLDARFLRFLRLPDTAVPIQGELAEIAVQAIVEAAQECRASMVGVTWRHDPHCDHEASALLVEKARPSLTGASIFEFPVWGWTLPPETETSGPPEGFRCDISARLHAKNAAVAAHRSQTTGLIPDDAAGFRLDADMLQRFAGPYEIFLSVPRSDDRSKRRVQQIGADYFERLYESDPDPWRFATSDYERTKYAATLQALPKVRYDSILEAGCSIGVFTERLAARCDTLLALDASAAALTNAKSRCAGMPRVSFQQAFLPGQWPGGTFDGIIFSEIVYYLDAASVALLARKVSSSIRDGGDIMLVHWLGETDYPLTGDQAAELFIQHASSFAQVLSQSRTAEYRLDLLRAGVRLQTGSV